MPSKLITCSMIDANGYYDGSAGSVDPYNGDLVISGNCTIKFHSINITGNLTITGGAHVIVTGNLEALAYIGDIEHLEVEGDTVYTGA